MMVITDIDELFTFENDGFKVICKNGKLNVKTSSGYKTMGEIYAPKAHPDKLVFKKFEREAQVYKKLNAWSIPHFIFKNVDYVWFTTETTEYKIKTADIFPWDFKILTFNDERKVYISKDLWHKTKK